MKTTSKTTNTDSKVKISYSKKIQKRTCTDPKTRITICSLPNDLIVDILSHVAASSISGFFNTKLSGKLFNKLANDYDDYMYNKLCLDEISCHPMDLCLNKKANSLFMRCLQSQNSEALYRQGVKEYLNFHQGKTSGLALLEKAADQAHLGASYLLGIIVICNRDDEDGDSAAMGLELLSRIETDIEKQQCREKLREIVNSLWLSQNRSFIKPQFLQCQFPQRKRSSWPLEDDSKCCVPCKFNQEIAHVCSIITGVSLGGCQMCYQD